MFGFRTKPPVSDDDRKFVGQGFAELESMLGRERLLKADVVLPDDRYFPDCYDGSEKSACQMAGRIAAYMGVDAESFRVAMFSEDDDSWREFVPESQSRNSGAAGLYFNGRGDDGRFLIGLRADQPRAPDALAATIAHELAHVLLLGSELLDQTHPEMEPLTDLATIYLGLGVLTANATFQFRQWTEGSQQGWSTKRHGYLSEPLVAYALAWFAHERGEHSPSWSKFLTGNVRPYFTRAAKWLDRTESNS